jgi:cytosine/adenosine deaminase-related metal-dependent hydrolase
MSITLIQNVDLIATMDDAGSEISNGALVIENGQISAIGRDQDLGEWADKADQIIDARGTVITPGLVNTHHHMFQTLTRAVPAGTDASLFVWLQTLYPIWARYRPEDVYASAQAALAELLLSGCTLTSDHHYIYPDGVRLENTIEAAEALGIRLHATRGSMSIGESQGGLPPDFLVEDEAEILDDTIRLIDAFHDPSPGAMVRIAVAPCSPFSVSRELMRDSALLARDKNVRLHTHLAENVEDVEYSLEKFGCRPGVYAEQLGWVGPDVWHTHCVELDADEIRLFAETGTGVAHCPGSNGRLGSGIAPIKAMREAGIPVGLGVDGAASNDSSQVLLEARQALLFQRALHGADAFQAREALRLATRGGADVLGWNSCGHLAVGMRADLVLWDLSGLESLGVWDPVAALVLCAGIRPRDVFVDGHQVVEHGRLTKLELSDIDRRAKSSLRYLMSS